MNPADAYLQFLAWLVLCIAGAGVVVGLLWSIPDAYRSYRYWDGKRDRPSATYSWWRFFRTTLAVSGLVAFLVVALTIIVFTDPENYFRQFVNRHLVFYVVVALTALVITEPVADRKLDRAIGETEKERDARRDLSRDPVRDLARDTERDPTRDRARDEWHEKKVGDESLD